MRLVSHRALLTGLFLAVLLIATPLNAHAHVGIESDPPSGSRLDAAPKNIDLSFSEPVDPSMVHIKLTDASNQSEVPTATSGQEGVPRDTLSIAPTEFMTEGSYTLSVRALGSDGHVVRSDTSFVIGDGPLIKYSPDADSSSQGIRGAATRTGSILGITSLIGAALTFTCLIAGLRSHHLWRSVIRVAQVSVAVGVVGAVLTYLGYDPPTLDAKSTLGDHLAATFATPFGKLLLLRIAALAALVITTARLLRIHPEDARRPTLENALTIIGFILAFSFAGSSHAAADDWSFTTLFVALIHLSAAVLWLSGLFGLAFLAYQERLAEIGPLMIRRFGQLAGWCAAAATVSGVLLAFRLTNGFDLSSLKTAYGAALGGKVAMVGLLFICALLTHRSAQSAELLATPATSPSPATSPPGGDTGQTQLVSRTIAGPAIRQRLLIETSAAAAVLALANIMSAWAGRI